MALSRATREFTSVVLFWATLLLIGFGRGGWRGWLTGALVGGVVAVAALGYMAHRAEAEERDEFERTERAQEAEREHLLAQVLAREPKPAQGSKDLGTCPDCSYTPIAPSCRTCPRCGCTSFIRSVGVPSTTHACSNCGPATSMYCEECNGRRRVQTYLVKDFRTGKIYWDRAGYETRGA
jgi:hypothetical protein